MCRSALAFLPIALAAVTIGATAAASPAETEAQPAPKGQDPEEVICEKLPVLGSRLATKRICMTRAKWAETRKLDREEVERSQRNIGIKAE